VIVALLCLACAVSFVVTAAVTPVVVELAVRHDLLDHPGGRRLHARAVPRLGGVGVFLGFAVALGAAFLLAEPLAGTRWRMPATIVPLFIACTILFAAGLLDDLKGVRPVVKLMAQTAAALLVCRAGFTIDSVGFGPATTLALGWLAVPVAVLWLVGVSNAFNLVDGLDGLAAGVGIVALMAVVASKSLIAGAAPPLYSVALIGALLGFLRYNRSPARIFLGDSGSLVVGFLLAYLTVRGATRADGAVLPLVPLCALGYPLLDTGIAMLRRWLRGDPLSRADTRHVHHQLRALGLSVPRAVGVICLLAAGLALLGLCATFLPARYTLAVLVLAGAVLAAALGYGLPWLRYHEFVEVGASLNSLLRTGRQVVQDKIRAREVAAQVRAAPTLEVLEDALERGAALLRLVHMELEGGDLARRVVPAPVRLHASTTWKLEYPLLRAGPPAMRSLHLAIWSSTAADDTSLSADRVARILAPAVAEWFDEHGSRPDVLAVLGRRYAPSLVPGAGQIAVGDFAKREPAARRLTH
jgi:UDP-GlcNAc:undecaprenyl-phosphate/decaprenyl-phosphate GlcNAc-1-phosphate transferase